MQQHFIRQQEKKLVNAHANEHECKYLRDKLERIEGVTLLS